MCQNCFLYAYISLPSNTNTIAYPATYFYVTGITSANDTDFLFRCDVGAQPSSYSVGTRHLSPEKKRPERKADCLVSSKTEIKNEWRYTSPAPYIFIALRFNKNRDIFIILQSTSTRWFKIWPELFVCKQVTVCPGHIWTTLYISKVTLTVVTRY
jgi:hypothetical protein